MRNDPGAEVLERLLAQEPWLRRLVRGLVVDADVADDVAQETWRRVLERPPRHVEAPRAWLATIARRVFGERQRTERRRERRELDAARERTEVTADPAWAERVEAQAAVHRQLAHAVLALDEPGRSTVVLRYFEGRSCAAIARAVGCPESTVRNRLRRALAELRERLDRESDGDRTRWLTALAPLAGAPVIVAPFPFAELLTMSLPKQVALAAVVVLLASLPFVIPGRDASPAGEVPLPSPSAPRRLAETRGTQGETEERVTAVGAPREAEPVPLDDAPPTESTLPRGVLEVLVLREGAGPAEPARGGHVWLGLEQVFLPSDYRTLPEGVRTATLDPGGLARFVGVPPGRHAVGVTIGGSAPVQRSVELTAGAGTRCVVLLGRGALHGKVHDSAGGTVGGARVQVEPAPGSARELRVVTWTDAGGRYEAPHLVGGDYDVSVDLPGHQDTQGSDYQARITVPDGLRVERDFGDPLGLPRWRGVVRTRAGEPALAESWTSGGRIHVVHAESGAYHSVEWGADGGFELRLASGAYRVSLSLPGRPERHLAHAALVLDEPTHRRGEALEHDLVVPGATVAGLAGPGRWIALRSAPDAPPLVSIQRPGDGRYRFDGIAPGRWWLTRDGAAYELVVNPDDTRIEFHLP